MQGRWKTVAILLLLAGVSAWLLNKAGLNRSTDQTIDVQTPDYTMENFTTWSMELDGNPKNRLQATFMAHYPETDATELYSPRLLLYRPDRFPLHVISDKGWATNDNDVLLLEGNVRIWEEDDAGLKVMEIITRDVRVLVDQEYAETDQPATLTRNRLTVTATGVRAWLNENRMEFLNNVHTVITPEKFN